VGYKTMTEVLSVSQESSLGFEIRKLRVSRRLTQKELANMARVSQKDISLLEHGLPIQLDTKRRLLKELWASKASKV